MFLDFLFVIKHMAKFIIFVTAFPLERITGLAVLGGLQIPHHSIQQSQIILLDHTKTEPSKVGDVIKPPCPNFFYRKSISRNTTHRQSLHLQAMLTDVKTRSERVNNLKTPNHTCSILDTWPKQRTWDLAIRRSRSTFSFTNFTAVHFVAKCHAVNSSQKSHLCCLHLR